ncbi:hypothetical protein C8Q77DRAFT_46361 [Trametes polyzona]|nr:hypothetical protein C8Q77DRAFT_46361 [Trametes polyzona]
MLLVESLHNGPNRPLGEQKHGFKLKPTTCRIAPNLPLREIWQAIRATSYHKRVWAIGCITYLYTERVGHLHCPGWRPNTASIHRPGRSAPLPPKRRHGLLSFGEINPVQRYPNLRQTSANTSPSPGAHVETHALAPPPPAATATAQNMNQSDVCVSCTQSIRRTSVRVTCGHTFDMKCFLDRCWGAARDESMFPPSCCQKPFNLRLYEQALGRDLIDLLERKRKEFGIRTIDRVYCHQRTCPTFVGVVTPSATNYRCPKCGADTCGHCEEKGHYSGIQCTRPYGGSEGLADGVRQKRCPACGQRIQFATGCNNVTCECSYRFCTACKARWGTCLCGQPDADRPNEAAGSQAHRHNTGKSVEHGIAVHDGWRVPRGPPESTVECPRGYHVCAHSWKRCIGGLSPCDGCRMVLVELNHCSRCMVNLCRRCCPTGPLGM